MDLRTWRLEQKISMREAAERCGVPQRSWEAWEYKRNLPSLEAAQKIVTGSGGAVTLDDLVKKNTGA